MRILKHTTYCSIDGYTELQITGNIAMTGDEYDAAREEGSLAPALLDMPNYDEKAELLELPLPKPLFPLTQEDINRLPFIIQRYVTGSAAIGDLLDHAVRQRSPNLSRS